MRRVAIVGASGFVGSVLVERLLARGDTELVPLIHSSGNAWRLARLGIPLKAVDLLSAREVDSALAGCSHVVNCSRGDDDVMIKGLGNLLAASRKRRIERFVHLSSVLVYGDPPDPGATREAAPTRPQKGSYGWIKSRQDQMVMQAGRAGMPSVILCPPNITGPCSIYLLDLLNALRAGQFVLLEQGSAPCNVVDVTNLAYGIELALGQATAAATRFFITDDEPTTWQDVVQGLSPLIDNAPPVPAVSREELCRITARAPRPDISIRRSVRHLVSSDVRQALRKDPLWAAIDGSFRRGAAMLGRRLEERLRQWIEGPVRVAVADARPAVNARLCAQQLRGVRHSCELAKNELGYRPIRSTAASFEAFRTWYRVSHGLDSPFWDLLRHLYQAGR